VVEVVDAGDSGVVTPTAQPAVQPTPSPELPTPSPEPPVPLTPPQTPSEQAAQTFFLASQDPSLVNHNLRRPITPESPAWVLHICVWVTPDPQRIIDSVPEDILPFTIFNLAMSKRMYTNSLGERVGERNRYPIEALRSWMRVAADNEVWVMAQVASGGPSLVSEVDPDDDIFDSIFGELFREFPNFIGWNYSEQFWGFNELGGYWMYTPQNVYVRYRHLARVLEVANYYGGFLKVSWCGNQWSPNINPIGMKKRLPEWAEASHLFPHNYILTEKFTQTSYLADMESVVLGAWLAGYSGNYGMRWDDTGWTNSDWVPGSGYCESGEYSLATGLGPSLERFLRSGMTVWDGPELTFVDAHIELSSGPTTDGYTQRRWDATIQTRNIVEEMFRLVINGVIRIPCRQEVIDNTKFIIIQDMPVGLGSIDMQFSSPATLFEGLYRHEDDGNLRFNNNIFKATGRYPAVPTAFRLREGDEIAQSFRYPVLMSEFYHRWPTVQDKVDEFNENFPEQYTGNMFADIRDNTWVLHHPFQRPHTISYAVIPFQFNTAERMEVTFTHFASGVITERPDGLDVWFNNFNNRGGALQRAHGVTTDPLVSTLRIYGSTTQPTFTYQDLGIVRTPAVVAYEWQDGVFTLTVLHNGVLEITIDNVSGDATNRRSMTEVRRANIIVPEPPPLYTGPRQREAEHFDHRNIAQVRPRLSVRRGDEYVRNFTGQGFMIFGSLEDAAVRTHMYTMESGTFTFNLSYLTRTATNNVALYVNGQRAATLDLTARPNYGDWGVNTQQITLNQGLNEIGIRATAELPGELFLNNIILEGNFGGPRGGRVPNGSFPSDIPIGGVEVGSSALIHDLRVEDHPLVQLTNIETGLDIGSVIYADRPNTFDALPAHVVGAEFIQLAMAPPGEAGDSPRPREGFFMTFTAPVDIAVYVAIDTRGGGRLQDWLANGWTLTNYGDEVSMSGWGYTFWVYSQAFAAGETVHLGALGSHNLMYSVWVMPWEGAALDAGEAHDLSGPTAAIIFDMMGGRYNDEQGPVLRNVPLGQNAAALTADPTREGYTFAGWAPELNLENVNENRAFAAVWE